MLTTIIAVVVVLGGLIFFHELGHFAVARGLGMGVSTFSLGFGPKILKYRKGKTEYALSLVPLGGYVALVGESDPKDIPEGFTEKESFALRPAWQRLLVVAAGPAANILLAWLLCWTLALGWGTPVLLPQVGGVVQNGPADKAGIQPGDTIVSINGAAVANWQAMADGYMASHKDVTIEMVDLGSSDYMTVLATQLAGSADLDIVTIKDIPGYANLINLDYLKPLNEVLTRDTGDFNGTIEQLTTDDGNFYAVPFRSDFWVLYYNKDLFDKAGVEYPSADMTWDEYEALAKKMTSGEGSEKVYGSHNHTWQALVANWAVQDGKNTLMSEDYSFLKPYYEQALRMQDEGVVQSYANLKTGSIHYISVFEQQQCAMLPMGSWFIGTLIQDKEAGKYDFNWGVTTIPHPADTQAGATVGSTTPVAINAKTDVPDLAWEYVKFVTGEEGAMVLADNGIFPAAESDEISSKLAAIPGFPEDGQAALKTTSWVLDRPLDAKMAAVRKVLEEEHDLIMIGEEDVDTGIANMNQRAQEARED